MAESSADKLLIIAGPTASGKSRLALQLAEHYPIAIINGDAMQLYRALPVLTAQPSEVEKASAPHLLYGMAEAHQNFSVARWLEHLQQAIAESQAKQRVPVIVGGSSMYLDRLINGLIAIPEIPNEVREKAQAIIAQSGNQALHDCLAEEDKNRLHPNDTNRIIRSYCVYVATGHSLDWWHQHHHQPTDFLANMQLTKIALLPDRQALYQNCNQRLLQMVEQGAIEEVQKILDIASDSTIAQAIGVKIFQSYLRGEITKTEAIEQAQQQTRHYAKRQYSWLNNHYHADVILPTPDITESVHALFS